MMRAKGSICVWRASWPLGCRRCVQDWIAVARERRMIGYCRIMLSSAPDHSPVQCVGSTETHLFYFISHSPLRRRVSALSRLACFYTCVCLSAWLRGGHDRGVYRGAAYTLPRFLNFAPDRHHVHFLWPAAFVRYERDSISRY